MTIEIETETEAAGRGWRDKDGFVGPYKPGIGPRTDPRGEFPTGPALGEKLIAFTCLDIHGDDFSFNPASIKNTTIMMFFRSAVW